MVSSIPYGFRDIESEALLLVEGADEVRFFRAFFRSLEIDHIQLAAVDGKDGFAPLLRNTLINLPSFPELQRLVLVRDADDSVQSAFQSLQSALRGAELPVPSEPFLTWADGQPSVSVAILPDGGSSGCLEDLCLQSLRHNANGDTVMACVDQYLSCRSEPPVVGSGRYSKSRLHTFLAVGERPGLRLGEAADAGIWDWESPVLQPLADFFRRL